MHISHVNRSWVLTRSGGHVAGVWAQDVVIYEGLFGDS